MLKRLFLLVLTNCLWANLAIRAQELRGRVLAASSDKPVAFATVGIRGKALGSTADESGRFAFAVPSTLPSLDSVVISCVGFRALRITVGQLRAESGAVWRLQPQAQSLNEVHVRHPQLKPAIMGRTAVGGIAYWTTKIRDSTLTVASDERGWEVATVLPVRRSCYVDSFRFYVSQNDFKPVRFRFVLYELTNDKPTRQLLTDDIQFTLPSQQTGWASLDLRSYNIELRKGQTVAAGIQWLEGEKLDPKGGPKRGALSGPGAFPSVGHRVLVRDKSEAEWRTLPVNVSMYLAVQEYK
ncbi:carboxypeptidase-like regulatory domain-containing protein [Hymenobacter properus]|uniref:Carboxypeptidase-like regulatory domain-containing protein n=1 Tax=Hymenobacter properus TaxID=2791026 RepID=A0A931FK30_9BACT|nr:carboxypeptidase-like regulatory domain-containing protein [Hymenobacter properus]MBF9140596.1 carboxypeptidase-like regulatory domain-containing protein [Hymenobacter properus]MBR7719404.1 carboxypeptidase-like regulatory domain-containing protein [Microvirga sp. SRT04]